MEPLSVTSDSIQGVRHFRIQFFLFLLNQFPVINPLKNKMNLPDAYVTIRLLTRREHSVLPLERVVCEYVHRRINVRFIMQNTSNK
jgi:hypothetical protein